MPTVLSKCVGLPTTINNIVICRLLQAGLHWEPFSRQEDLTLSYLLTPAVLHIACIAGEGGIGGFSTPQHSKKNLKEARKGFWLHTRATVRATCSHHAKLHASNDFVIKVKCMQLTGNKNGAQNCENWKYSPLSQKFAR